MTFARIYWHKVKYKNICMYVFSVIKYFVFVTITNTKHFRDTQRTGPGWREAAVLHHHISVTDQDADPIRIS